METTSLQLTGTPGFWMFALAHPVLTFFLAAFLIAAVFGTITDVLVAFAKRKGN